MSSVESVVLFACGTEARVIAKRAMTAAEILAQATRRTLKLPARGVDIALLDWGGDGPLALLHHANGFCKGVWGLVAIELRRRFRVIAMDARGHGDSSKPEGDASYRWGEFIDDLVAVAAELRREIGPIALGLGHSFGGTSFLGAARQRPDLFGRLLLLDPVVPPPGSHRAEHGNPLPKRVEGALRRRAIFDSRPQAIEQWRQRSFFARCDPRAVELYAIDGLADRDDGTVQLKCPGAVEAAVFAQGPGLDVVELARDLATPALVLHGAEGGFPRFLHEAIVAAMRDARLEDVPTGHLVPMERPDLVLAAAFRHAL